MIRFIAFLGLVSMALDCLAIASGEAPSTILNPSLSWVYWLFSASISFVAVRVLLWGTEP